MDNMMKKTTLFSNWKSLPVYFEKNSIIVVTCPPCYSDLLAEDIVNIVIDSLKKSEEKDLSFQLKSSGNSIVLRAINQLSCRIHFFSKKENGIIEFQKRFGCSIQFLHFYTKIKSIMMKDYPDFFSKTLNTITIPITIPFFNPEPFSLSPTIGQILEENQKSNELYYHLTNLVQTKYIDISTQVLSELASIVDNIKADLIPLCETKNFIKLLNDMFQTGGLSELEYITRILFVLSDYTSVKEAVIYLKESKKVDICETLRICLKNICPLTYMNGVLEKRLRLIILNFSM
jgi:hypothetical protein